MYLLVKVTPSKDWVKRSPLVMALELTPETVFALSHETPEGETRELTAPTLLDGSQSELDGKIEKLFADVAFVQVESLEEVERCCFPVQYARASVSPDRIVIDLGHWWDPFAGKTNGLVTVSREALASLLEAIPA